jgi:hypothetical protein
LIVNLAIIRSSSMREAVDSLAFTLRLVLLGVLVVIDCFVVDIPLLSQRYEGYHKNSATNQFFT